MLTVLIKPTLHCNCGDACLALPQTRRWSQACSQHGRKLGSTRAVAGPLRSTAQHGHAVGAELPTGQAQVGAFRAPPQRCATPTATGAKQQGHKPGRVIGLLLHPLLPTQTGSANRRRVLKSPQLTPFLTQTYSHIPRGDPACALDEATDLQKQVDIKLSK